MTLDDTFQPTVLLLSSLSLLRRRLVDLLEVRFNLAGSNARFPDFPQQ
jgi:hypothetical protein